ncbi:ATP-binding protein [Ramlibacter sp. AN1015]|uniref:ATP-binding protein n=1 Tax=Ramlibacter sp. AN1015 TaxID=3133428 RepID=UPI0030C515A5
MPIAWKLPRVHAPTAEGSVEPSGVGWLRLLLFLSMAVPLVLLAAFAAYRYEQMQDEAEMRLKRALSIAHEHALGALSVNRALLEHVRALAEPARQLDASRRNELASQLQQLVSGQAQVHAIQVRDETGRVIAASTGAGEAADGLGSAHPPPHEGAGAGGPLLSELGPPGRSGERLFDMSLARQGTGGRAAGVVLVSVPSNYFSQFHATLADEEPGVAVTLFRADGAVLSRWPPLAGAPERMSPRGEVLSRVLAGERSGTVRNVSSLDQQRRLILFKRLGEFPVYIGVGREFGALKTELRRELFLLALVGAVPVLGIVFTAWLAMKRTRQALGAAAHLRSESEARRQAEEALFQSQKMEALGRLTGGVAHDFNNALMVISGNLHLLRRTAPEAARRYLDAIGRAVESSAQLTRQLLAFSRRQALAPETVALQERLPPMRDLLAPTLGARVALSIQVAPDTPAIRVDPAELELALINLAVNARDAMPQGGRFELRAGPAPASEGGTDDYAWVLLEASDTGLGMDPETALKAFDPFFTTKPAGKGTGLGLSQVYALCQRTGGHADIRSTPGQGTTVAMRLPASGEALPQAQQPQTAHAALRRRVLLVEDNPDVARVVQPVLEQMGCSVVHVTAGAAALQALERGAERFDTLLSDVVLPGGLDGRALAVAVRHRHPEIAILLMTGYAEQIQDIDAQGFRVLPKPFTPESLADALAGLGAASTA